MACAFPESEGKYDAGRSDKVKVTILASEWGSSKGGLSTLNRNLAIQLAKFSGVKISFLVPQCSEKDKTEALSCNIHIIEARKLVAFEELDLLSFPPGDLQIDVVVGHGVKLGRQAQVIRDSHRCKWVQVVHTDSEEMGMFKCYPNPISTGEEKHKNEVKLCEMADFVVGIGPKLAEAFRSYLRPFKNVHTIFVFTPGICEEFLSVEQVAEERKHRSVLVFGRGDAEDFKLKGFDIAGKAIASLADTHLVFVGAPDGKHEAIAECFMQCGLPANCLKVRGYEKSRESLKSLFCEVDLMLMPSRTDGFGLTGLEALSAGLPVLVSKNSGFGEALCKVPYGSFFVVNSDKPEVWAASIKNIIWEKDRHSRLVEAEKLRESYQNEYCWTKQSDALLVKTISLVRAHLRIQIGVEAATKGSAQKGMGMDVQPPESQEVFQEVREPSTAKKQQVVVNTGLATENCGNGSIQSTQALLNRIADQYLQHVNPSSPEQFNGFIVYLEEMRKVLFLDVNTESSKVTVEVGSEKILEELWKDYWQGHLNEMAQKFLVTQELLEEFGLIALKLTTLIAEEEYKACKRYFSGKDRASTDDRYHSLGVIQHSIGDLTSALQSKQRALDVRIKLFGEDHASTADSYHALGVTQHSLGDFSSALQSAQRALNVRIKLFGEDHASTAHSYNLLGATQRSLGDYTSALQSKQRALDVRIKLFGEHHASTADSYHSLGVTQHSLGDYTSALQSKQRALDVRIKLFGEDHASTADNYHQLGAAQHSLGDYTSALQSKQRALDVRIKLFGEGHASTADSYQSLGVTQHLSGDYISALQSKQRALDVRIKLFGEGHASTADSYHSLGITQYSLGDYTSALQSAQPHLRIQIGVEAATIRSAQKGMGMEVQPPEPQEVFREVREPSTAKKQQVVVNTGLATENCGNGSIQSTQALLNRIAEKYLQDVSPSNPEEYNRFMIYLTEIRKALVVDVKSGSLIVTVEVGSEEILEELWEDYCNGHLNEMAQKLLVTEELLEEFGLIELKLTTLIAEEEYQACKRYFSGEDHANTADSYHSLGVIQHSIGDFTSALQSAQRALEVRIKRFGDDHASTADTYHLLGMTQHSLGDFTSALQSAQRALDVRIKLFGNHHASTADSYGLLGTIQHSLGDYTSALQSAQRALDVRIKLFGEDHASTADSYHLLGVTQHWLGDFTSALQSAQRALDVRIKLFGEEHASTADSYHSLGVTQHSLGDYTSALQSDQRALDVRIKLFGEDHASTADSYHSLGVTQHSLGDFTSALQSAQRALDVRIKLFGEDHASTADSYHSLGVTQHSLGDFTSALQSDQRALDVRIKLFGEDHASTADSYHSLGVTQHLLGDFTSALQSAQRALDVRIKLFGEDHASTADSYRLLGDTQHSLGDYTSALQSDQRALDVRIKLFGEEHASTADSYHSLGVTQHSLGDYTSALQSDQRALDVRIKLFGEDHASTADSYHSLGMTQHSLGDFTSALQSKQRALDVRIKLFGEDHASTADSYHSLGVTQHWLGDFTSALQSRQRALDVRIKLFGEDHASTADSYHSLGVAQHSLGDFTSALQSAQRALDVRIKLFGEDHPSTADSYDLLGATQHLLGDFSPARQSAQRALDVRIKLFGEDHASTSDS
ncbi:uncharacterized protein [Montipora capricornis]|uniref:uncharacterized protein n=1 Tax=Montipora capricornis TaxID=246305 RepID=UPI0035F1178B